MGHWNQSNMWWAVSGVCANIIRTCVEFEKACAQVAIIAPGPLTALAQRVGEDERVVTSMIAGVAKQSPMNMREVLVIALSAEGQTLDEVRRNTCEAIDEW